MIAFLTRKYILDKSEDDEMGVECGTFWGEIHPGSDRETCTKGAVWKNYH
jgi:hypothetical protein